ncbi:MAG: hypothetical protein HYS13_17430 [Planctomycetia bacterium]|nr:hypothetical protein [Planctomycetia bacterium]
MPFQFYCPQGHLLVGEPFQAGQPCRCPMCGMTFVIPQPAVGYPGAPGVWGAPQQGGMMPGQGGWPQMPGAQIPGAPAGGGFPAGGQFPGVTIAPAPQVPAFTAPSAPAGPAADTGFPGIKVDVPAPELARVESPASTPAPDFTASPKDDPNRIIHIRCPKGHELETPMDMVGEDAMCPHCQAQFRLRYEDSKEHREERRKERERREERWGKKALTWSIVLASLVLVFLLGLIILGYYGK